MELQKSLVNAAATCLLAGASATAMAVDCANGNLIGLQVDEVVINGQSCYMEDLIVMGDVTVVDSEDLTMFNVSAAGTIRVIGGGNAIMVGNTADGIAVWNNEYVNLVANAAALNIRVINNLKASVKKNAAPTLLCRENLRLDAFENEARRDRCRALGGGFDDIGGGNLFDGTANF